MVAALRSEVEHSAKEVGHAVSKAAKQAKAHAKTPMLVGGSALAGAAGGVALSAARRHPRRKVLGMQMSRNGVHLDSHEVAHTVRQVGRLTETAGHIAAELRRAEEGANGRMGLSPIEVLLRGLTTRH